jgi:hypothetical protein
MFAVRYAENYSFPIAVLYGNAKKDYMPFIKVIVDELKESSKCRLKISKNGKLIADTRVHLFACIGDGLEQQALMGHRGVAHTNGCRYCICCGEHPNDKGEGNNHGMYFVDRKAAMRTKESLALNDKSDEFVSILSKYKCFINLYLLALFFL